MIFLMIQWNNESICDKLLNIIDFKFICNVVESGKKFSYRFTPPLSIPTDEEYDHM
jgi:hypothetical protein